MGKRRYDWSRPREYKPVDSENQNDNIEEARYSEYKPAEKVELETFDVRVYIDNLNIRRGPGMNFPRTGKFTGPGVFTITKVQSGYGKLKTGEGWISLKFCEVLK